MRFSLIPREEKFFDMFDEVASNLTAAATHFLEMVKQFNDLNRRAQDLKKEEENCDVIIEKIILALDRTFITPFDREDIHTLATSLDDIMDNMEETSHRLVVFRIEEPTPDAVELAHIIQECCIRLERAIKLLRDLRHPDQIHVLLREIGKLENDADKLYRKADAAMFAKLVISNGTVDKVTGISEHPITTIDILTLIKWRELYAWLEETVDACKEVANVISEIVIKGT
jgi:uncharacterized protein Yka (UPF0111/DUF47 family)